MKKYEKIKAMSIDEMADYKNAKYKCRKCVYYSNCNGDCHNGIKNSLKVSSRKNEKNSKSNSNSQRYFK